MCKKSLLAFFCKKGIRIINFLLERSNRFCCCCEIKFIDLISVKAFESFLMKGRIVYKKKPKNLINN